MMDRELTDQVSGKKMCSFYWAIKETSDKQEKTSKNQKYQYYFRYLTNIIDWVL